ncbi:hypothetical protein CRUP_036450, partial [Coryphaenoides rupestris]
HPVHVDNCVLVSEINECIKEPPAYTHRDYSAILYLNDDFEGGDFIFTMLDGKTVTERIQAQDMLKMFSTPVDQDFAATEAKEPKDIPTETPPPADPEPITAEPTDTPQDPPTDTHQDPPTDTHQDPPTDTHQDPPTDTHQDPPTDTHQDPPTDTHQDPPTDTHQDPPKDTHQDPPTDTHQDPPTDTHQDPPTDTHQDPPTDTHQDPPTEEKEKVDLSSDVQVEKPTDTQKEKTEEESASKQETNSKPAAKEHHAARVQPGDGTRPPWRGASEGGGVDEPSPQWAVEGGTGVRVEPRVVEEARQDPPHASVTRGSPSELREMN